MASLGMPKTTQVDSSSATVFLQHLHGLIDGGDLFETLQLKARGAYCLVDIVVQAVTDERQGDQAQGAEHKKPAPVMEPIHEHD